MKSFFTKITFLALVLFAGAVVNADTFDSNPGQAYGYGGMASISGPCSNACANNQSSISYREVDRGEEFAVFLNFRNDSSGTIYNPRASFSYDEEGTSSSVTFTGTLSGSGPSRTDTVTLTDLPDQWEIEFIGGEWDIFDRRNENTGQLCSDAFPHLSLPMENNYFNRTTGITLPNLEYGNHEGWCQQGYVEAVFVVHDLTEDDGNNNGGNPVLGSRPVAITEADENTDSNSSQIYGDIHMNDFSDGEVFFVYGTDQSDIEDASDENRYPDVRENGDRIQTARVEQYFDGSDEFMYPLTDLDEDTTYYYRICVEFENNNTDELVCGDVERFDTDRLDDPVVNSRAQVVTEPVLSVTQTTATLCGDLIDDGGSLQQTWIELRSTGTSVFTQSDISQRTEGAFCEEVTGLTAGTSYIYRACTPEYCGTTRTFRTLGSAVVVGAEPAIMTDDPTNVQTNSARLNSTYVTNANSGTCYFEYGRTAALGSQTVSYNVGAGYGTCTHNFTQLASSQNYCVRAVISTQYGTDRGETKCFSTLTPNTSTTTTRVVVVEEDDDEEIDLSLLGLGLSLVRLEIDNDTDFVTQGETVRYVVEWENISELDLEDLDLKISLPSELEVTNISRGRLDVGNNAVYYTIDDLEEGRNGSMTVSGIIDSGVAGNLLTAEAELAYDNPVNGAQENAKDFDLDEYSASALTASIFGLGNVSFLGWLVILLGLAIIFLIARWMYLEREDMRAQAYAGRYQRGAAPMYPPQGYQQPPVAQQQPPVAQPQEYYEPYRPNR